MNAPTHSDTIDQLVTFALQRDIPITMMALERNGIIIGGLLVVTGEKNYNSVKAALLPVPAPTGTAGILPAPTPAVPPAPSTP
jgi:hypothetical protein